MSKQLIKRTFSTKIPKIGAQIIHDKLVENNVHNIFLYSGGAIMPTVDKFYNSPINYFINTHEQSLGHTACGYSKSSNKVGVGMVTSGPGLTNLVTSILDSQNDSSPMVVFSGQVPVNAMGTRAFQECPAIDITRPVTKWSYCVKNVNELPSVIDHAFKLADDGKKGVVHIDVPKDVQCNTFEENIEVDLPNISNKYELDLDKVKYIATLINKSDRPVFYVGKGVNDCSDELRKLVIKSNIPITSTIHAMGSFDETHPLSLKFVGMHGNAAANYAVQGSDCIICIGARFDDRTTGNVKFYAPNATIIHCNIEETEIDSVIKSHYSIVSDSKYFIDELVKHVNFKDRGEWLKQCQVWKSSIPFHVEALSENKIKTQDVIIEINKQLYNRDFIISTGVGNHQMYSCQFIDWKKPKTFLTSGSLGVMGVGLPYAIGAQIANPNILVIDIDGDGSFNQTLSELKTVREYNLPIKIAIMNDSNLSMVRVWEELFFDGRITATKNNHNPDYFSLARSFGIHSVKCDNKTTLTETVTEFLNYDGPILCDFRTVTDVCFPLVAPGKALDDLILHDNFKDIDLKNVLPPS
jgi:acetolactate synthase-1/2/3 large subunit